MNAKYGSENLLDVSEGDDLAARLELARTNEPELYGDMDDDDVTNGEMFGGRTLRQLRNDYEEILEVKVEKAVGKALESLAARNIDPDSIAGKLSHFEHGLGHLASNEQYLEVRQRALEKLAGRDSSLPMAKKIALRRMLHESTRAGILNFGFESLRPATGVI